MEKTKLNNEGDKGPSKRELEVLRHLSSGLHYKEIAEEMGIGVETVRTYIKSIYRKLEVNSRTEAALLYLERKKASSDERKA